MTSEAPSQRRVVQLPDAQGVADLAGAVLDLETVVEFAAQLEARLASVPVNLALADALSTAIAIRYSRCFAQGVRKKIPADVIAGLPEDLRQIHEDLLNLRDKHIAHSVNSFEDNFVTVGLESPGDAPAQRIVDVLQRRLLSFDAVTLARVRRLLDSLLTQANDLLTVGKRSLQQQIGALPQAQIAQWPLVPPLSPTWKTVRNARPSKRSKP